MSKISTKPAVRSVKDMYALFVKRALATGRYKGERSSKYTWGIANNLLTNIETGEMYMNYKLFKQIIASFNTLAGDALIKGYTLDLLNGLGNLFIARIQRNPEAKRLNVHESLKMHEKLKKDGTLTRENWKVVYTDDDYFSVVWHKKRKSLNNILLYSFKTAGGQPGKGYRIHMSRSIMSNPKLKTIYPYIPYVRKKKPGEFTLKPVTNGI